MSDYERNKGRLIPEGDSTLSLEARCELISDTYGWDKCDSWIETVNEEGCRVFYIDENTDTVYRVENKQVDVEYEFFNATRNGNGTIDFEVMYYNGGCSLSEAIEEAINDMDS